MQFMLFSSLAGTLFLQFLRQSVSGCWEERKRDEEMFRRINEKRGSKN